MPLGQEASTAGTSEARVSLSRNSPAMRSAQTRGQGLPPCEGAFSHDLAASTVSPRFLCSGALAHSGRERFRLWRACRNGHVDSVRAIVTFAPRDADWASILGTPNV